MKITIKIIAWGVVALIVLCILGCIGVKAFDKITSATNTEIVEESTTITEESVPESYTHQSNVVEIVYSNSGSVVNIEEDSMFITVLCDDGERIYFRAPTSLFFINKKVCIKIYSDNMVRVFDLNTEKYLGAYDIEEPFDGLHELEDIRETALGV